jgi:hypothetical protein
MKSHIHHPVTSGRRPVLFGTQSMIRWLSFFFEVRQVDNGNLIILIIQKLSTHRGRHHFIKPRKKNRNQYHGQAIRQPNRKSCNATNHNHSKEIPSSPSSTAATTALSSTIVPS